MRTRLPEETDALAATVAVDCTVSVPRDADGTLTDGVRDRLESIDGVDGVGDLEVGGLRPGLNDLTVDVQAELRGRADVDAATVSATFGVCDVTVRSRTGPPDESSPNATERVRRRTRQPD